MLRGFAEARESLERPPPADAGAVSAALILEALAAEACTSAQQP